MKNSVSSVTQKKWCIYRITNLINGKTYIGQHRYARLNDRYFGSGKLLLKAVKKYGKDNFKKDILVQDIETLEEANILEREYIAKERSNGKGEYNLARGGAGSLGVIVAYDELGNTIVTTEFDPRWINRELKSINVGKIVAFNLRTQRYERIDIEEFYKNRENYKSILDNTKLYKNSQGQSFRLSKDDPKIKEDNLELMNKGKFHAVDNEGKSYFISRDDPRFKSKELRGFRANTTSAIDLDGKVIRVSCDDERFKSGELTHLFSGKIICKDKDGNAISVDKTDERYLSGELVSYVKNTCVVRDIKGNKFRVPSDDPRIKSGELVAISKGMIYVYDALGKKHRALPDDPRILSGEFTINKPV